MNILDAYHIYHRQIQFFTGSTFAFYFVIKYHRYILLCSVFIKIIQTCIIFTREEHIQSGYCTSCLKYMKLVNIPIIMFCMHKIVPNYDVNRYCLYA